MKYSLDRWAAGQPTYPSGIDHSATVFAFTSNQMPKVYNVSLIEYIEREVVGNVSCLHYRARMHVGRDYTSRYLGIRPYHFIRLTL